MESAVTPTYQHEIAKLCLASWTNKLCAGLIGPLITEALLYHITQIVQLGYLFIKVWNYRNLYITV